MRARLETERLILRPWEAADLDRVVAYCGAWDLARMTSRIPHPYTLEMGAAYLRGEGAAPGEVAYAVDDGSGVVGAAGASPIAEGGVELGYWIGGPHRGQGYALEAAAAVCAEAISSGAAHIDAKAMNDNPVSHGVLRRLGFAETGPTTGVSIARDPDARFPMTAYRLSRPRWEAIGARSWTAFRLATERLIVEPFWPSDAAPLTALADDLAIARMMASIPSPFTAAYAEERIVRGAYAGRPGFRAAVRLRANGVLVGEVALGAEETPTLSYWLGQAHWGCGYAMEMLTPFVAWAAQRFDLRGIAADCYLDNPGSLRVLEKLGFEAGADTVKTCSMARDAAAPTRLFVKRFKEDAA